MTLAAQGACALLSCVTLALAHHVQDEAPRHRHPEQGQPLVSELFLHPERIALREGGYATVERGLLLVPIVRTQTDSKKIAVEVYRFRADASVPADTPPIFRLYGGPGWPGMGSMFDTPGNYEDDILPVTRMADLVVVGQRGIGSSVPNTLCGGADMAELAALSSEERDELLRQGCAECRDYWIDQGYDLSGFNVIEAAADVDDVRRHLGYEKITLWGASYGSHWGMAILRYFPDGVARALLTGMEGPDHTYDMPSGVLAALERMAAEAEMSPVLADHIPEGGLVEALRTVIESVEEAPFEVEVTNPRTGKREPFLVTADGLRDAALGYTSRVNTRGGVGSWPADVLELYSGEFEPMAQRLVEQQSRGDGGLPTASFFMLDCGSGISPEREAILNADPAAKIVGNLGAWYQTACPVWGADLGDEFRAGFETSIPTVIVHGTWDVSTPFDNALELLDSFPEASFVIVDTGSHGALNEAMRHSAEFDAAITTFLTTGDRSGLPDEVRLPPISWAPPR